MTYTDALILAATYLAAGSIITTWLYWAVGGERHEHYFPRGLIWSVLCIFAVLALAGAAWRYCR